jgi:hypothetical protein
MAAKAPVHFDPETVATLRQVLDDAWGSLSPEMQAVMPKIALAERILKSARRTGVAAWLRGQRAPAISHRREPNMSSGGM